VIYICIPALDEARTVGVLLWRIRRVMEEFPRDYHVLVLDDGSTDDTQEVLAPYARVLPLTLLRNERTLGYAASLERLLREAAQRSTHPRRDVIVTLQADFTESPEDLPNLIRRMEGGADVVGTTVAGVEGEMTRGYHWSRKGLPWLLKRAPLARELGDPLSGFRAYRVQVIRRALQDREGKPLIAGTGWAANAELLLVAAPHVRRGEAVEVSLRYTRRERPTRFRPWGTVKEMWSLARRAPRRLATPAADPSAPAQGAPAASGPPARPAAPAASGPSGRSAAQGSSAASVRPAAPGASAATSRPPAPGASAATSRPPAPTGLVADADPAAQTLEGERPERPRRERRKRPKPPRGASPEAAAAAPGIPAAAPPEAPSMEAPAGELSGDAPAPRKRRRSRPRRPRGDRPRTPPAGEGPGEE